MIDGYKKNKDVYGKVNVSSPVSYPLNGCEKAF